MARVTLQVEKQGPVSRFQLARNVGFSFTHICRIVDELIDQGELIETTNVIGRRGRPSTLLDINPDGAPVAGFRFGPEEADIAVANARGEILAQREVVYKNDKETAEDTVKAITQGIRQCVRRAGKDPGQLKGIGVAVAGLADPVLGIMDGLTNRPGWEGAAIVFMIEKEMGIPVYVDNDVRAGALAAQWFGGVDNGDVLYMCVLEGIGSAYVSSDLDVLRGAHDAAVTLGHTTIERDGPQCGCGNFGCLESVANDVAFIRYIWPDSRKTIHEMSTSERARLVRRGVAMAKRGEPAATAALARVTEYLGVGVANAVAMFDPRAVRVFGTLIDIDSDLVIDMIRREALRHISPRARGVEIQSLLHTRDFFIHGALGLVKWQPYRKLQEDTKLPTTVAARN